MKKKVFDFKYIKEAQKIKWWKRLLLFFCRSYYSWDWGNGVIVIMEFKKLFGKIYIVNDYLNSQKGKK